jgi:hypothetical protein
VTDYERRFMEHLKKIFDAWGEWSARDCARNYARIDDKGLGRLPDLLNHALEKKRNAAA